MNIRFHIDSSTGLSHIYKHGVDEYEVEEALEKSGDDKPSSNDSRIATGQTSSGRYLRIIYVPDPEPNSVFVITAYELRGKPLTAYRRRIRRRR
jgi:hypothetical protein